MFLVIPVLLSRQLQRESGEGRRKWPAFAAVFSVVPTSLTALYGLAPSHNNPRNASQNTTSITARDAASNTV